MTLYNHKGKPVNLTFTELFFTSFNAPTRRGAKALSVSAKAIRTKLPPYFHNGDQIILESPAYLPLCQFQTKNVDPPKPAEGVAPSSPPPLPPAVPQEPPVVEKPAASEASPTAGPLPWTATEDFVLTTMKAQNRTWKEIGDFLPGRDKAALSARHKDLMIEEDIMANSDDSRGAGKGGKGIKANLGNKPKGILKGSTSPKPEVAATAAKPKPPSVIEVGEGEILSGAEVSRTDRVISHNCGATLKTSTGRVHHQAQRQV